jgi:hypothetical protein
MKLLDYILVLKVFRRGKICYKKYSKGGIKNSGIIMNVVSVVSFMTATFIIWGAPKFSNLIFLKGLVKPLLFLSLTLNVISDTIDGRFRFYSAFI